MDAELFNFDLPPVRIAQRPLEPRDGSKLLVCRAAGRLGEWRSPFTMEHRVFRDVADMLGPDDWLVTNDAKVLPVRLLGHRLPEGVAGPGQQIGGSVEALLLKKLGEREWSAIMHLSARVKPGLKVVFEPGVMAEVLSTHEERLASEGEVRLKFSGISLDRIPFETWLERHGHVPLPPYIVRGAGSAERNDAPDDKSTYQTVYAAKSGSAAAPTAGFHFTTDLLTKIGARGARFSAITLHVGIGTFRPMKAGDIDAHVMHEETYEISEAFAREFQEFQKNRAEGGKRRLVAVGTTVVRSLESWMSGPDAGKPGVYKTRAFIKPGTRFLAVDDLITNFHLPKSTLLVLVGAAMGVEPMHEAYRQAIAREYRFFSYGDAMFIRGSQ